MGPNMTSIISLTAANTRQRCVDILLVYEANEEAEERNRVVFTVISFLHDVSPDVVNKAEKTLETSSVLL